MTAARPVNRAPPRLALFQYGFRPFFLLAGLAGAFALLAWLGIWTGAIAWDGPWAGSRWHGHEMIFGFAIAAVAGFLLTAVPNWTASAGLRGAPLVALAALWLAGRGAMAASASLPPVLVAAIDLAFLPALAVAVGHALIARAVAARSLRNVVFVLFFALLWTGDLLTHLKAIGATTDTAAAGLVLGRDTLILMISLVSGRIVPAFTRNALTGHPAVPLIRSERAVEVLTLGGVGAMLVADLGLGEGEVAGICAAVAAVAGVRRLALWQPFSTRGRPMLWILHLGYAWVVAGLALKALAGLTPWVPGMAAMHALTAGAIGTMLIAVMPRVALGHTGRKIEAGGATVIVYGLVTLAAVLRVAAPFLPEVYEPLVLASGFAWSAAFALFTILYLPILTRPRVDGRPG